MFIKHPSFLKLSTISATICLYFGLLLIPKEFCDTSLKLSQAAFSSLFIFSTKSLSLKLCKLKVRRTLLHSTCPQKVSGIWIRDS